MQPLFNVETNEWDVWTPIFGFENYLVSDKGVIVNRNSGKVLKYGYRDNKSRYGRSVLKVTLYDNLGKKHIKKVSRIVAENFFPEYNEAFDVHHLNLNPSDNRVINLEVLPHDEHIMKYHSDGR